MTILLRCGWQIWNRVRRAKVYVYTSCYGASLFPILSSIPAILDHLGRGEKRKLFHE